MLRSLAESRDLDASNVMVPTRLKTIANLDSVARPMSKLINQGWKQRKRNHVPTPSSA